MTTCPYRTLLAALTLSLPATAQLEPGCGEPASIGPLGGQATSVIVHPNDDDVVLVLQDSPPIAQGIIRSDDAAATFAPFGTGLDPWLWDLTLVPGTDDLYVIEVPTERLMKSTDFGATWTPTPFVPHPDTGPKQVVVSPNGDVFVLDAFSVQRSTDGGATWSTTLSVVPFGGQVLGELLVAPSDPSVVYVCFDEGLWRSDDGGASFALTGPFSQWIQTVTVSPADADVVLAGTWNVGLMRSTDGGVTFTQIGSPVTDGNPEFFTWEPDGGLWYTTLTSVVYSPNGVSGWVDLTAGVENNFLPIPLAITLAGDGTRYLGAVGGGLFDQSGGGLYRMDAGPVSSWEHIGFLIALINDVVITAPGGLRVIGIGSGVYSGAPGEAITPTELVSDIGVDTRAIAVDPDDATRWVTGGVGAFQDNPQIYVVTGNGTGFAKTYENLGAGTVQDVEFDPFDSNRVVAGIYPAQFGNRAIIRSNDGGNSWTTVGGTSGWATRDVAFDPHTPGRVLQLSDNNQWAQSLDGGVSWSALQPAWPGTFRAVLLEFDPFEPGVIYRGEEGQGLWRSDDDGASWTNLGVGLHADSDVLVHPEFPGWIWVSDDAGQVLVSTDRGDSFDVALDVPLGVDAAHMALDTSDGTMLVGTAGASTWEVAGASPVLDLGDGTEGTGGITPRHTPAGGLPQLGNAGYGLAGDGIVGGATVFFALGLSTVNVNAYGGTFFVGDIVVLPAFVVGGTPGAAGEGSFVAPLPIPNMPSAIGLLLVTQFAVVDPGALHISDIALSNGLSTRLHD